MLKSVNQPKKPSLADRPVSEQPRGNPCCNQLSMVVLARTHRRVVREVCSMKSVIRGGRRKSPTKSKKKKVSLLDRKRRRRRSQRTYPSLVMNWMKKSLMGMKS
ncbi:unnamed protein product, partial [Brassica rapa]